MQELPDFPQPDPVGKASSRLDLCADGLLAVLSSLRLLRTHPPAPASMTLQFHRSLPFIVVIAVQSLSRV